MGEKRLLHTNLCKKEIAKYCLLPGSPQRVERIAKYLDKPKKVRVNREYETWCGYLEGEKVLVMSTGMGGPSTAIGIEELVQLGAHTFIRIGSCATTCKDVKRGDVVIPQASVRMEGTSLHYVALEYPAVPTIEVFDALRKAGEELKYPTKVGTVICRDLFYSQYDNVEQPASYYIRPAYESYKKMGAIATEMETAAMFIAGAKLGVRTGACMVCATDFVPSKKVNKTYPIDYEPRAIEVGVEALRQIILNDKAQKKSK